MSLAVSWPLCSCFFTIDDGRFEFAKASQLPTIIANEKQELLNAKQLLKKEVAECRRLQTHYSEVFINYFVIFLEMICFISVNIYQPAHISYGIYYWYFVANMILSGSFLDYRVSCDVVIHSCTNIMNCSSNFRLHFCPFVIVLCVCFNKVCTFIVLVAA